MATITAALVKELRESTGAGMMDCKAALTETGGDIEAAVDWLRKKGLSKAAKKSGRVAAEGLVAALTSDLSGVVVEVNSETDFVARNADFQTLVRNIAQVALSSGKTEVEELGKQAYPTGGTVARGAHQCHRQYRREPHPAPRRRLHARERRRRALCAYADRRRARQDRGDRRARIDRRQGRARRPGAPGRDACRLRQSAGARRLRPRSGDSGAREDAAGREERRQAAAGSEKIIESGLKTYSKEVCLLDQVSNHPDHGGKTIAQAVKEHRGQGRRADRY